MTDRYASKRVGLFGGTFDPVHLGHLQVASKIKETLGLNEMRLMLAARPPLRAAPVASAAQRWQMLQLALQEFPQLSGDDRELRREGVSYSYDSVADLRSELGKADVLALCLGWDSLVSFHRWYRWEELLALCTLVVVNRPHHEETKAELHPLLKKRLKPAGERPELRPGEVLQLELPASPISATGIRDYIAVQGHFPEGCLTREVARYIKQNQLYGMQ